MANNDGHSSRSSSSESRRQKSFPFRNLFPRHSSKPTASASMSAISTATSSSDTSVASKCPPKLQDKIADSTKFAYADLLITILRLDFYNKDDYSSKKFCEDALEVILKWTEFPEKTLTSLRHHMEEEGSVNDDFVTLLSVIKSDKHLKKIGCASLISSLLVSIIEKGKYDSRFRVFLRHTAPLIGVSWDAVEELEDLLADRLVNDYEESEESTRRREHAAKMKKLKRYALIGAAGGLGAVLIGITGGLAAPLVATGITTLTASTAFAVLGSAAGSAIFGSIFGVAGGGLAGYRMKKRVGAIEEFVVEPLTDMKAPSLHCVLCVSGWVEENDENSFKRPWRHLWLSKEQYTLRYESKYLEEWNSAMEYFVTAVVGYAIQRSLMESILAGLVSAIAWPLILISSSSVIDNPWNVCLSRSAEVGEQLAEVLLSRAHGQRPITLIGFSLGARVLYHCLLAMSKREDAFGIIEDVVLLGAPVSASPSQWKQICRVVGGRIINGYCTTDWLLRFLYRTASVQFTIAGTGPVDNKYDKKVEKKIVNFNLSHIISGHTEYLKKLTEVLTAVGIRVTPRSEKSFRDLEKYEQESKVAKVNADVKDKVIKTARSDSLGETVSFQIHDGDEDDNEEKVNAEEKDNAEKANKILRDKEKRADETEEKVQEYK